MKIRIETPKDARSFLQPGQSYPYRGNFYRVEEGKQTMVSDVDPSVADALRQVIKVEEIVEAVVEETAPVSRKKRKE